MRWSWQKARAGVNPIISFVYIYKDEWEPQVVTQGGCWGRAQYSYATHGMPRHHHHTEFAMDPCSCCHQHRLRAFSTRVTVQGCERRTHHLRLVVLNSQATPVSSAVRMFNISWDKRVQWLTSSTMWQKVVSTATQLLKYEKRGPNCKKDWWASAQCMQSVESTVRTAQTRTWWRQKENLLVYVNPEINDPSIEDL